MKANDLKILVRGAGDIASGIIWNLAYAGFNVCCTEVEMPSTIRTEVAFSTAIYEGSKTLDGVDCIFCEGSQNSPIQEDLQSIAHTIGLSYTSTQHMIVNDINRCWEDKKVALILDPSVKILDEIKFDVVIDAILAKKNLGTRIDMAPLVIGVGPGFTANVDCHIAIETMRGHNLARIIENGSPMENTGVPGLIAGYGKDRVIHSPASGVIHNLHKIGDIVKKGDVLAEIIEGSSELPMREGSHCIASKDGRMISSPTSGKNCVKVLASIDGILRGIIKDGYYVTKGLKIADIDPRLTEKENCFTISDKARSIGAAVVVAIMHYLSK